MAFLLDYDMVATMNDLHLITVDDIGNLHGIYNDYHNNDPDKQKIWNFLVSSRLRFLIEWFNSYHHAFGNSPELGDLTKEICYTTKSTCLS